VARLLIIIQMDIRVLVVHWFHLFEQSNLLSSRKVIQSNLSYAVLNLIFRYPLDVAKRRMQLAGTMQNGEKYK